MGGCRERAKDTVHRRPAPRLTFAPCPPLRNLCTSDDDEPSSPNNNSSPSSRRKSPEPPAADASAAVGGQAFVQEEVVPSPNGHRDGQQLGGDHVQDREADTSHDGMAASVLPECVAARGGVAASASLPSSAVHVAPRCCRAPVAASYSGATLADLASHTGVRSLPHSPPPSPPPIPAPRALNPRASTHASLSAEVLAAFDDDEEEVGEQIVGGDLRLFEYEERQYIR